MEVGNRLLLAILWFMSGDYLIIWRSHLTYYHITKWLELKFLRQNQDLLALGLSLLSKRKLKFLKITQKEFKCKCKFNNVFKFKYNFKNVLATLFAYYNGCKVNRDALGAQHKLATLNLVGWMKKKKFKIFLNLFFTAFQFPICLKVS